MSCNCIKNFDFYISFKDCKTLVFKDLTTWAEAPETYLIGVQVPGQSSIKEIVVTTEQNTVITSEELLGINQNLPAGIYCITVLNCNGDIIKKDFLNLCILECSLANLISNLEVVCDNKIMKETVEKYSEIKILLEAIKAKFECDYCSNDDIKELITFLKKLLNGEDCFCK